MAAYLARPVCRPRAYALLVAGAFLPGGHAAVAAVTDGTLQLLLASEGPQEGEGQLDVVSEQPLFATARALARLPSGGAPPREEQDLLALLSDSGSLSVLRFDAALSRQAPRPAFVAVQQLRLPPERSDDPFLFLAAHPSGDALAAATLLGTLCLSVRQAAAGGAAPAGSGGGGSVFGEPAVLELQRHVWSLAFAGAQQGPGGLSAAAPAARAAAAMAGQLRLAALHRHPGSSAMALAEYACSFPQGQPSLELSAFEPLSGDDGGGGFGLPRALAQMPPGAWQAAAWCVQCEGALRLLGRPGNDRLEQEPPEAAFRRYDQYQEWLQPQPGAAAGGGAPAAAAQPAEPAAGGEAGGPEPMAMSSQPSRESLPSAGEGEGSEADEEMSEAAQPAPGAAGAAAAGVAALADAAPPVAAGGGGAAGVLPGGDASQRITCCCWEWQAAAAGGQEQPVLACAFEDGTTQRWQLPSPAGVQALPATGTATLAPTKDGARGQRLAQPARCLASLPGGLLLYGTDCSGLHLLRLAQPEEAPGTAGGAPPGAPAAAAPSAPAAAPAAAAYEPLAPPFLSGSQQGEAGACCALPAAGQVADCLLADLEGCGQRQVYAACRSTTPAGGGGTLCVLYPDPKPETVFELPGAAEGITGLWGLRRRPSDPHHSLALLSYLGGSRLLAAQGGIFRDVTDSYALEPSCQTLAAGNLPAPAAVLAAAEGGAAVVAQVTSRSVVLFSAAPAVAALSRQGSEQLAGGGSGEGGGSPTAPAAWHPPPGSSIGAAVVSGQAVLLFCTGASRQLVALLPAAGPAGERLPSLVPAAHFPLAADVSCISNVLHRPQQAGPQSAVFAVGTYSSAVLLLQLRWDPQRPQQPASLALLQAVDLAAASSLPPSMTAAAAAAAAAASPLSPRALQREQLTPESLLLLAPPAGSPGASADASASLVVGLRTGCLLQLRCSWGAQGQQVEELLAVSAGHMPVVLLPLPPQPLSGAQAAAGMAPPAAAALSDRVSLLRQPASAAAGGGRVRWQQLALGQVQAAAALLLESGNMGSSSFMLDAVAAAFEHEQLADAAGGSPQRALLQQPPPPQQQLFLLCAAADGCLRMVSLDAQQLASTRAWPLPLGLQPGRLALHAPSGGVVVGGSSAELAAQQRRRRLERRLPWEGPDTEDEDEEESGPAAAVLVIDPATGDLLASYAGFLPEESISALCVWDPSHPAPQPPPAAAAAAASSGGAPAGEGGSPAAQAAEGAAAEVQRPQGSGGADGGDSPLRSHPLPGSPEQPSPSPPAPAAEVPATAAGEEQPWGGFIVVGTTIGRGEAGDGGEEHWDDESSLALQGRLLLLQLTTATAASASAAASSGGGGRPQLQLLPVAEMHLPSRVLALCPGTTDITGPRGGTAAGSSGGSAGSRLFASVGRRLVSLEWRRQALKRAMWVPTNRPICSLQIANGLLATADRREGVTLYEYYEHPPGSAQQLLAQRRGRLVRRYRLAPPGAGELRHRLGLHPQPLMQQAGPGAGQAAREEGAVEGEEREPGFTVVAADACCRPAVGAVALQPTPTAAAAGGSSSSGGPEPAAAAVLDATGRLCLLQQRWPQHEPALHQRCSFQLGEPAVALLPGSLGYEEEAAAGGPTAAPAAEMVAVTAGGSVLALSPLEQGDARQLLALQRALALHPATAPVSGSSHAAHRGTDDNGSGAAAPLLFRHPMPPGVDAAAASELLPPPSPTASTPTRPLPELDALAAEPASPQPLGAMPAAQQQQQQQGSPLAAAAAAAADGSQSGGSRHALAAPGVDAVLDGDLLRQFLLLSPAEQEQLVAGMAPLPALAVGGGAAVAAAEARDAAAQLSNLVARLLL